MKYKIELTENQMRVVQYALEEYFRLRLGQVFNLSEDLICLGKEEPVFERSELDDANIAWADELLRAIFRQIWPPYGTPPKKTPDMLIAECIWDAMRFTRGQSRWNEVLHVGSEPVPKIEKVEE